MLTVSPSPGGSVKFKRKGLCCFIHWKIKGWYRDCVVISRIRYISKSLPGLIYRSLLKGKECYVTAKRPIFLRSTKSCESGMVSFEICNKFHLVLVFLKSFERLGWEGIFRASYSGDLVLVPQPGIRLFWPKIFSCFSSVGELDTQETAWETYSWIEVWQ